MPAPYPEAPTRQASVTLVKLAKGCGVELWELFKFDLPLPAVAEDPAKYGGKTAGAKGTAKPAKRRTEKPQA